MLDVSDFSAKHHLVGLDLEETPSMQTEWRMTESLANFSLLQFPANRELNKEYRHFESVVGGKCRVSCRRNLCS
jgi:hypothetical protein